MGRLEEIEKRIVSKASVMHPIAVIRMDDAAWLIARLREAKELYGKLLVNAADEERISEWAGELLANLEVSDA